MTPRKSKLGAFAAFAALAALALAVSCTGFFPPTTYSSIAIQGNTQIPLEETTSFTLYGTDSSTNARDQITSGAVWSIGSGSTGSATITNGGLATGTGLGSVTINAAYQGLTTSTTAVVYLTNIDSICVSLDNTSGSCSATTETISSANPIDVDLFAIASYTGTNGTAIQDVTTSATWTISGPSSTDLTCSTTTSPADCTFIEGGTEGTYTLTVSYPGTSITGTNTIQVGP
jgi:hypothetical protein